MQCNENAPQIYTLYVLTCQDLKPEVKFIFCAKLARIKCSETYESYSAVKVRNKFLIEINKCANKLSGKKTKRFESVK